MSRALYTAATGMQAQQMKIDVIANNLANVNTDGYKQSRAEFQDLIYQNLRVAGEATSAGTASPVGLQVGLGVRPAATVRNFQQGSLKEVQNRLAVAISGDGFFQVRLPSGEIGYTRNGSFEIGDRGQLQTVDGHAVEPPITLPADANLEEFTIAPDGQVTVRTVDSDRVVDLGRLRLVRLLNQGAMEAAGNNLYSYRADPRSIQESYPSEDGLGSLQQGFLESSNVEVVKEMVAMITGQRAYEANSKVIQAADRMLEEANRLR